MRRVHGDAVDEEIVELCARHPHVRFDRSAAGELLVSPRIDEPQAPRIRSLCLQLAVWHGQYRTGQIFDASIGFRLRDGYLAFPDAAWIASPRWDALTAAQREQFPPLCPDVLFELASPGSMPPARAKAQMYLRNGAMLTVLIDSEQRSVELHRLAGVEKIFNPKELNIFELQYFALEAAKIFT